MFKHENVIHSKMGSKQCKCYINNKIKCTSCGTKYCSLCLTEKRTNVRHLNCGQCINCHKVCIPNFRHICKCSKCKGSYPVIGLAGINHNITRCIKCSPSYTTSTKDTGIDVSLQLSKESLINTNYF